MDINNHRAFSLVNLKRTISEPIKLTHDKWIDSYADTEPQNTTEA